MREEEQEKDGIDEKNVTNPGDRKVSIENSTMKKSTQRDRRKEEDRVDTVTINGRRSRQGDG